MASKKHEVAAPDQWAVNVHTFEDVNTGELFEFTHDDKGRPIIVIERGRNSGDFRTYHSVDGILTLDKPEDEDGEADGEATKEASEE